MNKLQKWRVANIERKQKSGYDHAERRYMASVISAGYSMVLFDCLNANALVEQLLYYKCHAEVQEFKNNTEKSLFLFRQKQL